MLELAPGTHVKVARQAVVKVLDEPVPGDDRIDGRRSRRPGRRRRAAPGRPTRTSEADERQRPRCPENRRPGPPRPIEERVAVASKTARPGRRLIIFGLVVAALYGGVALGGEWKPKLGLDLQGGTRITLEASTANGQKPTPANLEEARGIIDQRVNGSRRRRVRGRHPGQRQHRRRDPRPEPRATSSTR